MRTIPNAQAPHDAFPSMIPQHKNILAWVGNPIYGFPLFFMVLREIIKSTGYVLLPP
jgi:hypothetical protein